jgi:hypothetical protein
MTLLFLSGCETAEIADFEVCPIELPYSRDGYCTRVISKKERIIPKEEWRIERRSLVCLPHDSYKMLKRSLYKQCFNNKCKQALDSVGSLFESLDEAVRQMDGIK